MNRYAFTLVGLCYSAGLSAADLPAWITKGITQDSIYHYIVCSHEGLDPEDVKQVAESKCLASTAKLGGVTVRLNQKTVQSLTGADASEVAEIQPLVKNVQCEWMERYLEKIGQSFRIWLQCRVKKSSVQKTSESLKSETQTPSSSIGSSLSSRKYKRAILTLAMAPQADRIVVIGDAAERVTEVTSNVTKIELHEGDIKIRVKKHQYKDSEFELKSWKHGDNISKSVFLEKEM